MTESEIKEALNDMNPRSWEALVQVLEDHIYNLEQYLTPAVAKDHGVIANWAGGIYAIRDVVSQLKELRISN